jgi:hypothetical protein
VTALASLSLGEKLSMDGVTVVRESLFGFRVGEARLDLDEAEKAIARLVKGDGGGDARPGEGEAGHGAAWVQTPDATADYIGLTCARPSHLPAPPSAGSAEGVRWHAARADSVHVILDEWVERHKPGRRSWERRQGQAVCKPRGFRQLARTSAEPTCKGCLDGVREKGIMLKAEDGR